jgi:predicted amidohydrolase
MFDGKREANMAENMDISLRRISGAGIGFATMTPLLADAAGAVSKDRKGLVMQSDGGYVTDPPAKNSGSLGIAQCRGIAVKATSPAKKQRENVQHICELIDCAGGFSGKKDMLFFHEFPIIGYNGKWTLADARMVAIEIPGEETEALAKKARKHGSWLVFGFSVRDSDWPESLLSIATIMNDRREIVDKHWKARNIKGAFFSFELFTTTIYDVLNRYVEIYGQDHVVPVTRTPLGNIATSSIQREPEYFSALAMKGAEVILRTATGGFSPADVKATSRYGGFYKAECNNAASPNNGHYFEDAGGGNSAIYGHDGEMMEKAETAFKTPVSARIPIAQFRARHRHTVVHAELLMPVFEGYRAKHPPGRFGAYQRKNITGSGRYLQDKSGWR